MPRSALSLAGSWVPAAVCAAALVRFRFECKLKVGWQAESPPLAHSPPSSPSPQPTHIQARVAMLVRPEHVQAALAAWSEFELTLTAVRFFFFCRCADADADGDGNEAREPAASSPSFIGEVKKERGGSLSL